MAPPRLFCRLRREVPPGARGVSVVPAEGMCLSAFLVLSPPGAPGTVLLGRIDPRANWEQLGALDTDRAASVQAGWMLPSSHLLLYESPHNAARRIASEQLARPGLRLGAPIVVSDASPRSDAAPGEMHWDLGFIFSGEWPRTSDAPPAPWSRLELVDLSGLRRSDIVRGQADILVYAGRTVDA
ncbi:MAG TPA: hypothetical protein VMV28_05925 [Thermoplasmata archaeon]|nr:hypothetical protein [Thermoplasmata archaeon]